MNRRNLLEDIAMNTMDVHAPSPFGLSGALSMGVVMTRQPHSGCRRRVSRTRRRIGGNEEEPCFSEAENLCDAGGSSRGRIHGGGKGSRSEGVAADTGLEANPSYFWGEGGRWGVAEGFLRSYEEGNKPENRVTPRPFS